MQKAPLTFDKLIIPVLKEDEVLIKNEAVAQNPCATVPQPPLPHTNGCDLAGTILSVGESVARFKPGDRVCAMATTADRHHGAYQEYTVTSQVWVSKIPADLSFEDACTIPLCFSTAYGGIHALGIAPLGETLEVPIQPQDASVPPVLVWGAGSCVGAAAVQLVKWAGYRVIATASASNHEYVKRLGADWVVDYKDLDQACDEINTLADGKLNLVYDAIQSLEVKSAVMKLFGPSGGRMSVNIDMKQIESRRVDVEVVYGGALDLLFKPELKQEFCLLESAIAQGVFVTHPIEIIPGGLAGVNKGWEMGREEKVRGKKLVYVLADTISQ
ncbi:GroES-like protein [Meredithblackwellia eburnea MCA 4105]